MAATETSPPVALVTGAARRIGRQICQTLHAEGFNLVVHYNRSAEQAVSLQDALNAQRPGSAQRVQGDLNQLQDLRRVAAQAVSAWGRLDALVNNASTYYATPIASATEQQWNDLLGSNVKAPYFLAQTLAPSLRASRGSIVNISDIQARNPLPEHSIYCLAKAANNMLTRALAQELAPHVRVNGVAPGSMLWPEDSAQQEMPRLERLSKIPLGELGGAQAIARTILFLLRDAPYITGEVVTVDGGRSLTQF